MMIKRVILLLSVLIISIPLYAQAKDDFSVVLSVMNFYQKNFQLYYVDKDTGKESFVSPDNPEIGANELREISCDYLEKGKTYDFLAKSDSSIVKRFDNIFIPYTWRSDTFTIDWHLFENEQSYPVIEKIEYYEKNPGFAKREVTDFNATDSENILFKNVGIDSSIKVFYNDFMNNDLSIAAINILDDEGESISAKVNSITKNDKSSFTINFTGSTLRPNHIYEIKIIEARSTAGELLETVSMYFTTALSYFLEPVDTFSYEFINGKISIEWEMAFLSVKDTLYYKNKNGEWVQPIFFSRINPKDGVYSYNSTGWVDDSYEFKIVSEDESGYKIETPSFVLRG